MLLIWRICVQFAHRFNFKNFGPEVEPFLSAGDVAAGSLMEEPVGDVGRVVHAEADADDE